MITHVAHLGNFSSDTITIPVDIPAPTPTTVYLLVMIGVQIWAAGNGLPDTSDITDDFTVDPRFYCYPKFWNSMLPGAALSHPEIRANGDPVVWLDIQRQRLLGAVPAGSTVTVNRTAPPDAVDWRVHLYKGVAEDIFDGEVDSGTTDTIIACGIDGTIVPGNRTAWLGSGSGTFTVGDNCGMIFGFAIGTGQYIDYSSGHGVYVQVPVPTPTWTLTILEEFRGTDFGDGGSGTGSGPANFPWEIAVGTYNQDGAGTIPYMYEYWANCFFGMTNIGFPGHPFYEPHLPLVTISEIWSISKGGMPYCPGISTQAFFHHKYKPMVPVA